MKHHYTHPYILQPPHKVTVDLVGLGGTGSQVLTNLARINEALVGTGHPGIHVRAWDPDQVESANLGRQLFSQSDLGINKAIVLTTRVNRFFGYEWEARSELYKGSQQSNILITCVDTAKARIDISDRLKSAGKKKQPTDVGYYWLDIGNLQKTGQVVIGTLQSVDQPKPEKGQEKKFPATAATLPTCIDKFPQLKRIVEKNQGPSCSLAEALEKQDLFINSTLAQFGCNLIWKLIREGCIRYHGCFVNLETLTVNPIKI